MIEARALPHDGNRFGTAVVVGLGAIVCGAIAVAVSAAQKAGATNHSPIVPPGDWHVAFQGALALGFLAYVAGAVALIRADVDGRIVFGIAAVVQLLPLFGPVLLSTDVGSYVGYADLHEHAYVVGPTNEIPSVYGPLFTMLTEGVRFVTQGGAELALRSLAAIAVLASAWLASQLARDAVLAAALVGWNPLLALHFGGGGHNDALFVSLILAGLLVERRTGPTGGLALWASSVFVKWLSLALAPIHIAAMIRRANRRYVGRAISTLALSLLALGVLASWRYGTSWIDAARTISHVGRRTGSIGPGHWIDSVGLSPSARDRVITLTQVSVVLGMVAWAARTGRSRLGLAATLLAATQGWLNPWYAMWGLGLAAADETDRVGRILAVLLSAYLILDASTW